MTTSTQDVSSGQILTIELVDEPPRTRMTNNYYQIDLSVTGINVT